MQINESGTDNPYPDVAKLIEQDLSLVSAKTIQNLRIVQSKDKVYVYKCLYDGNFAVIKYYEDEDDRREILNYQILARHGISTIKPFVIGKASLVLEDISESEDWRMGNETDFEDEDVAKCLAHWYFAFHENGSVAPELNTLYFEYDSITKVV